VIQIQIRVLALITESEALGRSAHPIGSRNRKLPSLARSPHLRTPWISDWPTPLYLFLSLPYSYAIHIAAGRTIGKYPRPRSNIHEIYRTSIKISVQAGQADLGHGVIKNCERGVHSVSLQSLRKLTSLIRWLNMRLCFSNDHQETPPYCETPGGRQKDCDPDRSPSSLSL
jgi:hypothetical protein